MNEVGDRGHQQAVTSGIEPSSAQRWLQFRLRTLIFGIVAVCTMLGGWHLSVRPYVLAGPAVVGKPFVIRGRFADFLGFDSEHFSVHVSGLRADGSIVNYRNYNGRADRQRLCAFDVEIEFPPILPPGKYDIELFALTRAVHDGKTTMEAHPVRGKMVVRAAE